VAALWEWSRLVNDRRKLWMGFGAAMTWAILSPNGLFWQARWPDGLPQAAAWLVPLWGAASLSWVAGGAWLLRHGPARWPDLPQWLRQISVPLALLVAGYALVQARLRGVNFLLSALALVWAADIAAYFVGRALGGKLSGGRKLAPSISPGKSWEGAAGGFLGVLLTAAAWTWMDRAWQLSPSLYTIFWQRGVAWFAGALALLTAMSVVGDLTESLVKRAAGVKDSSRLLPGHGGVLDRIDALLPTLPLALLLVSIGQEVK
ncbi:MAG: phosphatidate cytidylyltransferase, partial [Burkholderiaceae bacterium]|nr:phosphatidate cytidylyltransferase [Burkholderiaceae bacterium]